MSRSPHARAMVGIPDGPVPRSQPLNNHGEVNGNVILKNEGTNPLSIVEPWDMLIILGHGITVRDSPQAQKIGSDDLSMTGKAMASYDAAIRAGEVQCMEGSNPRMGMLTATANGVAQWLDGKLKKDHVLLKLAMCLGGWAIRGAHPGR